MSRLTNKAKASALFIRADQEEERGNLRSAFRLMLSAARLGDTGAQVNVGNYYDDAKGVQRNRSAALYWYKRAYRRGDSGAANNIGVLWRKEKQFKRALGWFVRAVKLGDDEANLEIGKH
jgi:TPR repeat protein